MALPNTAILQLANSRKRFGRLVCVRAIKNKYRRTVILCRCDCGRESVQSRSDLESGRVVSCGCFHSEMVSALGRSRCTHNLTRTPIYITWVNMWQRCENKKHKSYARYGGRGIHVCSRWKKFENFQSDMGDKPEGMTLGRINNDGDYCPSNCRWETPLQQQANTCRSHPVVINGVAMIAAEWERTLGMPRCSLSRRMRLGWSPEKSISTPITRHGQRRTKTSHHTSV